MGQGHLIKPPIFASVLLNLHHFLSKKLLVCITKNNLNKRCLTATPKILTVSLPRFIGYSPLWWPTGQVSLLLFGQDSIKITRTNLTYLELLPILTFHILISEVSSTTPWEYQVHYKHVTWRELFWNDTNIFLACDAFEGMKTAERGRYLYSNVLRKNG